MHRLHRHGASVRSRLLLLLNSVGPAAVAPPERWRHLACATYDVPTIGTVIQLRFKTLLKIEISTTQEKHSLTIFNDVI